MTRIKKFNQFIKESNKESDYELVNESIISKAFSYLLLPIALPLFLNSDSKFKLKIIESAIEKYLNSKAEYEIIDEARYDIERPSLLNDVTKKRNEISKVLKRFPTLQSYKENFCKWLKKWNLVNFRNKEDIDWLCDQIMKIEPIDEESALKELKARMEFNMETGKVEKNGFQGIINIWHGRQQLYQNDDFRK